MRGMLSSEPRPSRFKRTYSGLVFSVVGLFQLAIYIVFNRLGDPNRNAIAFLEIYTLLFIAYFLAVYFHRRVRFDASFTRALPFLLFVFSIAFRIVMVVTETHLSTDIMRYMWDGMLLGNGVDPYKYVPSAPELERFKSVPYYQSYDHKNELTVYPPLAQLFLAASYLISANNPLVLKSLISTFDVLSGVLVVLIIRRAGTSQSRAYNGALVYLWNPSVVIEFSNSGHLDGLTIFLLLLSLYLLLSDRVFSSSLSLMVGVFTKWIPLLMIPVYAKFFSKKDPANLLPMVICITMVSSMLVVPFYLSSGLHLVLGVADFIGSWRFESALSRLLAFPLSLDRSQAYLASAVSLVIFGVTYAAVVWGVRLHRAIDVVDDSILVLALFYLAVPVVFPWYALYLVAFASITQNHVTTSLGMVFSAITVFNYLGQFSVLSETMFWVVYAVSFTPVILILLFQVSRFGTVRR